MAEEKKEEKKEEAKEEAKESKKDLAIAKALGVFSKISVFFSHITRGISSFFSIVFSTIWSIISFPLRITKIATMFMESDSFTKTMMIIAFMFGCVFSFSGYKIYKHYEPAIDDFIAEDVLFRIEKMRLQRSVSSVDNDVAKHAGDFFEKTMEHFKSLKELVFYDKAIVKLDTGESKMKLLEFDMYLECDSIETAKYVKNNEMKLKDAFLPKLQTFKSDEIKTEEGKQKLKEAILEELNAVLEKGKVTKVFFTNFVIE